MWHAILYASRIFFWPLAILAVFSFCILCSENFGAVDLSGLKGDFFAWTFVITSLLSFCVAGPALYGDS